MTLLDKRIEEDLRDLYNNGRINGIISAAEKLQSVIKGGVSTKGLPGHFTGKRSAETVFVTLNPGQDVANADINTKNQIRLLKIDDHSTDINFISTYMNARIDLGNRIKGSAFDVKQARFLKEWKNSGIIFPLGFPSDSKTFREAKKIVLLEKLQLELVPYCSKNFDINNEVINDLLPFMEILFDEIFNSKRTYVIFASAKFESLFKLYQNKENAPYSIILNSALPEKELVISKKKRIMQSHCRVCKIIRKSDNKSIKSIIAHTYPYQRLNGDNMSIYGKFCYTIFNKTVI